jgi:hypothetical protein
MGMDMMDENTIFAGDEHSFATRRPGLALKKI